MNPNLIDEKRKKIYDELADLTLDAMERGEMDLPEVKKMAKFTLKKLDGVKKEDELFVFIETLCQKWAVYNKVYLELRSEKDAGETKTKIEELQKKIASLMN